MKAIANTPFLKARQNLSKTWTPPVGARIPTRIGLSSNENLWLETRSRRLVRLRRVACSEKSRTSGIKAAKGSSRK